MKKDTSSLDQVDLVELLRLDQQFSETELDLIMQKLQLEILLRFIDKDVKPHVSEEVLKEIQSLASKQTIEFDDILAKANLNIDVEERLKELTQELRKEFIETYLDNIEEEFGTSNNKDRIELLVSEIKTLLSKRTFSLHTLTTKVGMLFDSIHT